MEVVVVVVVVNEDDDAAADIDDVESSMRWHSTGNVMRKSVEAIQP